MKVNYKFQFQVRFSKIDFNLNDSVDIEISNFEKLQFVQEISDDINTIRDIYFAYYGYEINSLLASHLDRQDLAFLTFLDDVSNVDFDCVKFDGDFVPVVGFHGDGYEFVLYVNEG